MLQGIRGSYGLLLKEYRRITIPCSKEYIQLHVVLSVVDLLKKKLEKYLQMKLHPVYLLYSVLFYLLEEPLVDPEP
jgi:hypothetical protein